jgi:hypothetical protein
MNDRSALYLFAIAAVGLGSAARGHHSEAGFNVDSVVAFQGTVTAVAWRNPHVYFSVETTAASGQTVEWEVETGGVPLLERSGWHRGSLQRGDRVTVRGHPARDPARPYALLLSLEKTDGTVLQQIVTNSDPAGAAASLAGVWKGDLSDLGDLASGFRSMPLTAAGIAAQQTFDANTEHPAARCIAYPTPALIVGSGFWLSRIELREDVVTIRNEWFDAERNIHLDGRGHPENGARTIQGHSIGWWEGATLVVDTAQFADHRSPYQTGVPSGSQKHVVERFTLSEDGTRIQVEFTLEDPQYLAEPFSGTVDWVYRPDLEFFEFDCDPAVSSQYVPG